MSTTITKPADTTPPATPAKSGSRSKLTERASLNAAAMLLDQGIKQAVNLVVTPILVSTLGRSLFGVWQIISKLVHFMAAADGRPTLALKWLVANRQAEEDDEAKRRYVGSALMVWALFLPLLATAGAVIVWMVPRLTRVAASDYGTVRLTAAIVIGDFILVGLIAIPEAVLRGMNLGYKRMGVVASLSVVGGAASILAVAAGFGIVGLAIANVLLSLTTAGLFYAIIRRAVPWFGIARPAWADVFGFLRLSGWYFAWTLINTVIMSIDVVLLGALASTSVVTVYVLSAHATQIWLSAISLGLGAVTPGLGSLIGSRDFARAAEMRAELLRMVWLLAVTAGSVILLWNPSFVRLWIGQGHFAGTSVNLLLVLLMTQLCIARADSYIIDVTLQMRDKVYVGFVAAAVSALAAAALIPSYKILGLCAGLLLGRLVLSISYPILISRQFGRNGMLRPSSGIRPAMATCILFGGCAILGSNLQANSWLLFLIGAPLSAWAIVVLAMRAGLDSHQRSVLLQRLRKLRLRETGKGSTVT